MIPLREFRAYSLDGTVHTTKVAQVLHQSKLYGKVAKTKKVHIKFGLESARRCGRLSCLEEGSKL